MPPAQKALLDYLGKLTDPVSEKEALTAAAAEWDSFELEVGGPEADEQPDRIFLGREGRSFYLHSVKLVKGTQVTVVPELIDKEDPQKGVRINVKLPQGEGLAWELTRGEDETSLTVRKVAPQAGKRALQAYVLRLDQAIRDEKAFEGFANHLEPFDAVMEERGEDNVSKGYFWITTLAEKPFQIVSKDLPANVKVQIEVELIDDESPEKGIQIIFRLPEGEEIAWEVTIAETDGRKWVSQKKVAVNTAERSIKKYLQQLALGGYGTVRGYPQSKLLGDYGWNVVCELLFPPPFIAGVNVPALGKTWSELVRLKAFVDHGEAVLKSPLAGEDRRRRITGFGFGGRLSLSRDVDLILDVGFPATREDYAQEESNVIYLKVSARLL